MRSHVAFTDCNQICIEHCGLFGVGPYILADYGYYGHARRSCLGIFGNLSQFANHTQASRHILRKYLLSVICNAVCQNFCSFNIVVQRVFEAALCSRYWLTLSDRLIYKRWYDGGATSVSVLVGGGPDGGTTSKADVSTDGGGPLGGAKSSWVCDGGGPLGGTKS